MKKLTIYDNTKNYFYPNGAIATPEMILSEYPMAGVTELKPVIETDINGIMFYTSPEPMSIMADRLNINPADYETDDEVLRVMEEILNAPPAEVSNGPSAEERIAAAMEYQNLINM